MGVAAGAVVAANRGARQRTQDLLTQVLTGQPFGLRLSLRLSDELYGRVTGLALRSAQGYEPLN